MRYIKKYFTLYKEQMLYIIFGIATTLVNWVVYTLSLLLFNLAVSSLIAWFMAVVFAFFVNKRYVFVSGDTSAKNILRELLLFFGARILSGIIEVGGLPLLVYWGVNQRVLGIEGAVAKAIISVVIIVSNYFFSKFIIFKK